MGNYFHKYSRIVDLSTYYASFYVRRLQLYRKDYYGCIFSCRGSMGIVPTTQRRNSMFLTTKGLDFFLLIMRYYVHNQH